jgi:hypothetical protein
MRNLERRKRKPSLEVVTGITVQHIQQLLPKNLNNKTIFEEMTEK